MAYCSITQVRTLTNIASSDVDDAAMSALIIIADTYCDSRISAAGIPVPVPSPAPDTLSLASANFTAALCISRKRTDLSRPVSLSLGGDLSFSTSPDTEIQYFETAGQRFLAAFIADATGSYETIIDVVEGE